MNKKLTLSLDQKVIEKAKSYAKDHNTSLSSLVENYFLHLISELSQKEDKKESIVQKLSGIISLDGIDYKDEHRQYLEEKYK